MMLFKIIFVLTISFNVFAAELKVPGVKRGGTNPLYEFQMNHLIKKLIERKQYNKSVVVSTKIQNKSVFELRKILKRITLDATSNSKNIQPKVMTKAQRQNSRFNRYRRYHVKNQWTLWCSTGFEIAQSRAWITSFQNKNQSKYLILIMLENLKKNYHTS